MMTMMATNIMRMTLMVEDDDRRRMTTIEVTMITLDLCCHNIKLIFLCNKQMVL